MGRKVDMKKIENITKCQVTFSKRRSSLMKKAQEISVCCDVDIAFIAFSPSGRVSKFCSQKRIENVIQRFVNLPADKRLHQMQNVQEKMEKLRQLDHIKGDSSKLHFLDKQIENLELQIQKSTLELQIFEANLRDYEPSPDQEPSLHQLSWCERNLKQSLQRVMARKNTLLGSSSSSSYRPSNFQSMNIDQTDNHIVEMGNQQQGQIPFPYSFDEREVANSSSTENPTTGQLLVQFDPWIVSPYSNGKVREGGIQNPPEKGNNRAAPPSGSQAQDSSSHPYSTANISMADLQKMNLSGFLQGMNAGQSPPPPNAAQQFCPPPQSTDYNVDRLGHINAPLKPQQNTHQALSLHMNNVISEQDVNVTMQQPHLEQIMNLLESSSPKPNRSLCSGFSTLYPDRIDVTFFPSSTSNSTVVSTMANPGVRNAFGFCPMQEERPQATMPEYFNPSIVTRHNHGSSLDNSNVRNESGPWNPPHDIPQDSLFDILDSEETIMRSSHEAEWGRRMRESGIWEWNELLLGDNWNLGEYNM